jgi:hypothetical protein
MRLSLADLWSMHPKLWGHPTDYAKLGALALQRAEHVSPVRTGVYHGDVEDTADIEWHPQDSTLLRVLDSKRVTEDGAEAVALAYVNAWGGWAVKRRLQQSEGADWLLHHEKRWLALEVSGMAMGGPWARLKEKKAQVAGCPLAADRLAVVVAFDRPDILADRP